MHEASVPSLTNGALPPISAVNVRYGARSTFAVGARDGGLPFGSSHQTAKASASGHYLPSGIVSCARGGSLPMSTGFQLGSTPRPVDHLRCAPNQSRQWVMSTDRRPLRMSSASLPRPDVMRSALLRRILAKCRSYFAGPPGLVEPGFEMAAQPHDLEPALATARFGLQSSGLRQSPMLASIVTQTRRSAELSAGP